MNNQAAWQPLALPAIPEDSDAVIRPLPPEKDETAPDIAVAGESEGGIGQKTLATKLTNQMTMIMMTMFKMNITKNF